MFFSVENKLVKKQEVRQKQKQKKKIRNHSQKFISHNMTCKNMLTEKKKKTYSVK